MKKIALESVMKQINENSVKNLDLTGCEPSVSELKQILNALNENTSIVQLDLGENPLSSEQNKTASEYTKALADFIAKNKRILFLKLGSTKFQDNDCIHLAKALEENTTLMCLELSYNNIGFRGAKALSALLMQNLTLLSLDLMLTPLGISGLEILSESLDSNKILVDLALAENDIDDAELLDEDIAKKIEKNRKHFEERLQVFPIIPKEIIDMMHARIASDGLYNPFIKIYNFQNTKNKSATVPVTFSAYGRLQSPTTQDSLKSEIKAVIAKNQPLPKPPAEETDPQCFVSGKYDAIIFSENPKVTAEFQAIIKKYNREFMQTLFFKCTSNSGSHILLLNYLEILFLLLFLWAVTFMHYST